MALPTVCPIGNYCPEGSIFTSPCPPGTYNIKTGLYDSRECTSCSAGYYCPFAGMSQKPEDFFTGTAPSCARTATAGSCAETATGGDAVDTAACSAVTALNSNAACDAVLVNAGGGA